MPAERRAGVTFMHDGRPLPAIVDTSHHDESALEFGPRRDQHIAGDEFRAV